jgi:hypothetical protein
MKNIIWIFMLAGVLFGGVFIGCNASEKETAAGEAGWEPNLAYSWTKVALEATANDTDLFSPRPTINSRTLALVFSTMFDAWAAYDEKAVPVYLGRNEKRPADERNQANQEEAISYATYRALLYVYPLDSMLFTNFMRELGYDPTIESTDPATPAGLGNLATLRMIEARKNDGANMHGDMAGGDGTPYSDYTSYAPANTPDVNKDIDRWQPKYFTKEDGGKWAPGCLTPHWQLVRPMFLDSASQFRPGPPPVAGSEILEKEIAEVVELQANLTNEEKALVEFMRDGPRSVQQAGHWLVFAQDVSERDRHTLEQDVKMYFAVAATAMDCFIAAWETKMYYDNARPYAQVHYYFRDKPVRGWGGPHQGTVELMGQDWQPYSPAAFLCPPFPAYVSGHSCVSGGCAKTLEQFTGSDAYGVQIRLLPGWLTEPGITQDSITLDFPTFTSTAEQAGWSRVLGGYHIQIDNVEGLELGRNVSKFVYKRIQAHFDGTVDAPLADNQ